MAEGHRSALVTAQGRRNDLAALREALWQALELAEPREVASLSRELRAVNAELAALPNPQEADNVVDLRASIARKRQAAGQ